jgi:hypothetical protein
MNPMATDAPAPPQANPADQLQANQQQDAGLRARAQQAGGRYDKRTGRAQQRGR